MTTLTALAPSCAGLSRLAANTAPTQFMADEHPTNKPDRHSNRRKGTSKYEMWAHSWNASPNCHHGLWFRWGSGRGKGYNSGYALQHKAGEHATRHMASSVGIGKNPSVRVRNAPLSRNTSRNGIRRAVCGKVQETAAGGPRSFPLEQAQQCVKSVLHASNSHLRA